MFELEFELPFALSLSKVEALKKRHLLNLWFYGSEAHHARKIVGFF